MGRGICAGAAVALLVLAVFGSATSSAAAPGTSIDVELAFDTTGSMAASISAARQDAERIVAGVQSVVPDARFGIVSFRDHGNPGGEYETLQPLTADTAAIRAALGRLQAVRNDSPDNLVVESYNLAFHRSYTDDAVGWRPDARKIVIVIGDAEPYGAGAAGLPGCSDTHADPDHLDARTELAGMRASGRTLVMIRELSPVTMASLECYRSLVSLAYPGGAATDGNAADLVTPLVALVRRAVAPIVLRPSFPFVLPGASTSVSATLANPNGFPLQLDALGIKISSGFARVAALPAPSRQNGGDLVWTTPQTLSPGGNTAIRLAVTAGSIAKLATISASGTYELETGDVFKSDAQLSLYVTRHVRVDASAVRGGRGITGGATVSFPPTARSAAAASGPQRQGAFTVRSGGRILVMRPYAFRLSLAPGRAAATFAVRVTRSTRVPGCRVGARGKLAVVDRSFGALGGTAMARVVWPPGCRLPVMQWLLSAGSIRPVMR
jgi:hypothetical protein